LRIFALEYAAGGGILERPELAPCRAEGEAMLRALATDLSDAPGVEVATVLDGAAPAIAAARVRRVERRAEVRPAWDEAACGADAVWPVAPETDGILAGISCWAERRGVALLASRRAAVELAGSKRRTAALLARAGVPVVPTLKPGELATAERRGDGWVAKPDDGVGGDGARWFATPEEARQAATPGFVVQPFLAGTSISISLLAADGEAWLLACNVQDVVRTRGGFVYRGFRVGAAEELRPALAPIAEAVAAALPGLWGHVGVDLVATADGPVVLEVNPRLTTSYVGLRRSIGLNPAALAVELLERPLAALRRPLAPRPVAVAPEAAA
jgi:tyramine---L-glutamate ligase